ncbi:hypothetical protein EN829_056915 [Mesorhizobium sp. M00.F.Ca.ET.186.01.1.1]|nr:hypothetical protein EN829_056915 [Mesorhizobium sp. M00.F.Ca.ET.186.01.1.1]
MQKIQSKAPPNIRKTELLTHYNPTKERKKSREKIASIGKKPLQIIVAIDKMRVTVKKLSHLFVSKFVLFFTGWNI